VLQVEAPDVSAPKKVEIRFFLSGTIPPQPQLFRLCLRCEEGVSEFEEGVSAAMEAIVE